MYSDAVRLVVSGMGYIAADIRDSVEMHEVTFGKIVQWTVIGSAVCAVITGLFCEVIGEMVGSFSEEGLLQFGAGGFAVAVVVLIGGSVVALIVHTVLNYLYPPPAPPDIPEFPREELGIDDFLRGLRDHPMEFFEHQRQEPDWGGAPHVVLGETIPEEFENDPVLRRYICPITLEPIRHPVIDPTSVTSTSPGTIYERAAIEEWIDMHHTSPLTRAALHRGSLVAAPEVQRIIDNRLRELRNSSAPEELGLASA